MREYTPVCKLWFALFSSITLVVPDAGAAEPVRVTYSYEDPAAEKISLLIEGDRVTLDDHSKKLSEFDMSFFKRQADARPVMSVVLQFVPLTEGDTANMATTMLAMVGEANNMRLPYSVMLKSPKREFFTEIRTSRLPGDAQELLISDQGCRIADQSMTVNDLVARLRDRADPIQAGTLQIIVALESLKKPGAWRNIEDLLLECNARHVNGAPKYLYSFYIR